MYIPHSSGLDYACNVLVAGSGEEFDLLSALPLYFSLSGRGKNVSFANYSFANLEGGIRISENLVEIDSTSDSSALNFSEKVLFDWSEKLKIEVPIFCFDRKPGCQRLFEAYEQLVYELDLDAIVFIDNGLHTMMNCTESSLDTRLEAMTSLLAIDMLPGIEAKLLVTLGLGESSFLESPYGLLYDAIDSLFKREEFKGACLPELTTNEVKLFIHACEYFQANMVFGANERIENLVSALKKRLRADYTGDSLKDTLHLTALCFSLADLVAQAEYIPGLEETKTLDQVAWELTKFRHGRRK